MSEKLGQHYLINKVAGRKIVDALELESGDVVIEIGPGRGALTFLLAKECAKIGCQIVAIEKDKRLVEILRNTVEIHGNKVEIIHGDVLKILPNLTSRFSPLTSYKLVGNIPYYITGRLLRILSELKEKSRRRRVGTPTEASGPKLSVLTIQKEVAQRIAAGPPRMNLLAAIIQFWAEPKILMHLKPKDFSPPPKVDSAIVKLKIKDQRSKIKDKEYYKFIRIIFKQPRKTIFNNLRAGLTADGEALKARLKKFNLTGAERPENLDLEKLMALGEYLKTL